MCSPVEYQDLVPSLPDNSKSQAHSKVPECDGRPTVPVEPSPIKKMFKQICQKWFTHHVDLFVTCLNHRVPFYVYPVPDQHSWDIVALRINWSALTAYAYPLTALLRRMIQNIILIAPDWPGMPWFWDLIQLSTEIPLQLPLSTTLLKQSTTKCFTTIHNISTSTPGV